MVTRNGDDSTQIITSAWSLNTRTFDCIGVRLIILERRHILDSEYPCVVDLFPLLERKLNHSLFIKSLQNSGASHFDCVFLIHVFNRIRFTCSRFSSISKRRGSQSARGRAAQPPGIGVKKSTSREEFEEIQPDFIATISCIQQKQEDAEGCRRYKL
jgi:hypothetical protein